MGLGCIHLQRHPENQYNIPNRRSTDFKLRLGRYFLTPPEATSDQGRDQSLDPSNQQVRWCCLDAQPRCEGSVW